MHSENDVLNNNQNETIEFNKISDFDELEAKLQEQLESQMLDLEEIENYQFSNPESLGQAVIDIVREQFRNQFSIVASEDFINENNGLTLDLSNDAHIQTTENFAEGKIATHNTKIDYEQKHNDWQANFKKDAEGKIETHKTRTGKEVQSLKPSARKPYDEGRPKGSAKNKTDMDHTISAGEIIRDPAANVHMTKEERINFANSDANLNEMDSSMNRSKADLSMTEWLDTPNANGQKPEEIFDISKEKKEKMKNDDEVARKEYEKKKKEGEAKSIAAGKQSQKEEFFRISGKALRTAIMILLSELMEEIVVRLVQWLKSGKHEIKTLIDSLKDAIKSFVSNLKKNVLNAGTAMINTVVNAIFGPIANLFSKIFIMLKQSLKSIRDAVEYIKKSENREKPTRIMVMELSKIATVGVTAAGAIGLSETIEIGLSNIPPFAVQIPLLGSLANILGIFFGSVVSGIIGAIIINLIDKQLSSFLENENSKKFIQKSNELLTTQNQIKLVNEGELEKTKSEVEGSIYNRHVEAEEIMSDSINTITENCNDNKILNESFSRIDDLFKSLEE